MSGPESNPRLSARQGSGVIVPHTAPWPKRTAAWLVVALVQTVAATLRYRWHDQRSAEDRQGRVIYCAWHNRLALTMKAYFGYIALSGPRSPAIAALVSASKDGAFLAAILEAFGVQPVRGSSSRRGPQALLELTTWAERDYDLAITPDGPRGPRYQIQHGVMSLAQVTGLPIIPFSWRAQWKIELKSWDRFQIPLPGSRCDMHLGKAIRVPRDASEEQRRQLRSELERILRELSGD